MFNLKYLALVSSCHNGGHIDGIVIIGKNRSRRWSIFETALWKPNCWYWNHWERRPWSCKKFFFFFFGVTILIIFLVLENIRNVLQLYCFPSYAYQASFLVSTIFKWLPDYFLGLPKKWSCLNSGLGDREISTIPLAMLEAPLVFGQS